MAEPRYFVQTVVGSNGDTLNGTFLSRTATLADAFTVIGQAIEKDQGSDGRPCYTWFVMKKMTPDLGLLSKRSDRGGQSSARAFNVGNIRAPTRLPAA